MDFNLKEFVENSNGMVVRRESVRYPGLFVLKYHRKVFYNALWTPEMQELRGMVVDADYNIIVHPFTKVFNRGENGTDIPLDEDVIAVEKINGFLGVVTPTNSHGVLYSTTGSLDSDFADLVSKHVPDTAGMSLDYTYLFEICDETDPHIVPEYPGAYLIGMREKATGKMMSEAHLDAVVDALYIHGWKRPAWCHRKFSEVVDEVRTCRHEGFMVYGKDTSLKMKSPYYLVKKLLARMTEKRFVNNWLDTDQIREIIDEEYYPLLEYVAENRDRYQTMSEQDRLTFMREFLEK